MKSTHENYEYEVQHLLISYMLHDENAYALSQNIIKPFYFDATLQNVVKSIIDYADEYNSLPKPEQVKALSKTNIDFQPLSGTYDARDLKWYLKTIEGFCRFKALERVIYDAEEMLNRGEGADVEKRVKDAMTISLMSDLGVSYFDDPATRLQRVNDKSNFVSTGWTSLDRKLNGGFTKGALNVFAGGSGSGKSLFLQNLALNWALMGLNVIYFSLELSEDLVAMRIDSMTSGIGSHEILQKIGLVSHAVAETQKNKAPGDLFIKKMSEAGTTANDLRAYVKEYEIQRGYLPDAIIVDYLDLMYPNNSKVDPGNLFTKDKLTSEEMRAMAHDFDCLCATASQLNRQSVEAAEFDHSHIAGGISKINTADNVFGIFTTSQMRDRGVYEIQFLKTRSAASVGQKIKLKFGVHSLRIEDDDGSLDDKAGKVETIKDLKSNINTLQTVPLSPGDKTTDRIRQMMTKNK